MFGGLCKLKFIQALYQQRIIHRDLKLENIIRTNGIIKIIDLGLAKLIPDRDRIAAQSNCGTEYTKAPEVKKWLPYGVKVEDVLYRLTFIRSE